jgi:hypothetical protein
LRLRRGRSGLRDTRKNHRRQHLRPAAIHDRFLHYSNLMLRFVSLIRLLL